MAAIALWVGFDNLAAYVVYVALAAGMIATVFATARSLPLPRPLLGEPWALRLHRRDAGIPLRTGACRGGLLVYPQTIWFASLSLSPIPA